MNTSFAIERKQKASRASSRAPLPLAPEQEVLSRLVGTRAELEVRIGRTLEHIMRLHLEGRDGEAWVAAHALCQAMDTTIEAAASIAEEAQGAANLREA